MDTFINQRSFPISPPIKVKVFQDYDKLDNLAIKRGYIPIEPVSDEKIDTNGFVGMQNSNLHCGWIATIGDSSHRTQDQIDLLNEKVKLCENKGEKVIIGFCQTGHFSVGYSIYKKEEVKRDANQRTEKGIS